MARSGLFLSVARKFLADIEIPSEEVRDSVIKFMPFSFTTVNDASREIFQQEKRFVYTTPKSFLGAHQSCSRSCTPRKWKSWKSPKSKYETGVTKLEETGAVVSKLEEELKETSIIVEEKKKTADAQAEVVGKEKTIVEGETNKANIEAAKVRRNQEER